MQYLPRETSSKDGSPDRMPHQGLVQLRRVGQEVSQVVVAQGAKGLLRRHEDGPRPRVRHQDAEERGGAECSQGFPKLSAKREVIHIREHRVTLKGLRLTSDERGKTTCIKLPFSNDACHSASDLFAGQCTFARDARMVSSRCGSYCIVHGMTNAHSDSRITWPFYLLYLPGMYSHEIEKPHYQIKGVRVHFNTSGTIGERIKV